MSEAKEKYEMRYNDEHVLIEKHIANDYINELEKLLNDR